MFQPKSNGNRARTLDKRERTLTLCTNETCIKSGAWLVDGEVWCGHHAGAAALDALEQTASKSE